MAEQTFEPTDRVLDKFARDVASGQCVWFIGSGFSLPELPSATKLTQIMLDKAFSKKSRGNVEDKVRRWETLKRVLLGATYENDKSDCGLSVCKVQADIQRELNDISKLAECKSKPMWLEKLLHLGRVADVLYRTALHTNGDLEMAELLCLKNKAMWRKPPTWRHHLLALLMVEGLVPAVITTNYDTLIEDAYKEIAGGWPRRIRRSAECYPSAQEMERNRPPIYKIHGCRAWYCEAANDHEREAAAAALVVTERQLQHWRDERWNWAHDALTHSLRFHPFLFLGFSGDDPVLQATLNALAEEPSENTPSAYVCKELTFPLYQYLSHRPGFDATKPDGLLPFPGDELLTKLYPQVIEKYYATQARGAEEKGRRKIPWKVAHRDFGCPDSKALTLAMQRASELLGGWGRLVAEKLVGSAGSVPGRRIRRAPAQYMMSWFEPTYKYRALTAQLGDYEELVHLLALCIARNYKTVANLKALQAAVRPALVTDFIVAVEMPQKRQLYLGFIPAEPYNPQCTDLQSKLSDFLERFALEMQGYDWEWAFLYTGVLKGDEMKKAWDDAVAGCSHEVPKKAQLWSRGGYCECT